LSRKKSISTKQNGFVSLFYPWPITVNSTYDKLGKPPGYLRRSVAGTFEYEDHRDDYAKVRTETRFYIPDQQY